MQNMKLKEVQEGESVFLVPDVSKPEDGCVFYNPDQAVSRDMSILVYKSHDYDVLDSMAASGARAIRLAKNGVLVVANDFSTDALDLMKKNASANAVDFEITNREARKLLHERKFAAVDIDPFGSPAPFIHCALHSALKLIGVAATDTPALTGTYPRVSRRRYGFQAKKLSNYPEVGVRALAGFVVREAAKLEIAARPVFAHAYRHYYRVYFDLKKGAKRTDKILGELGDYQGVGPIYMGNLWDKPLIQKMMKHKIEFGHPQTKKHIELIKEEADYPLPYHNLHGICKELKISPPPMVDVLRETDGVRTHFAPTGFRSAKSWDEVRQIISLLKF